MKPKASNYHKKDKKINRAKSPTKNGRQSVSESTSLPKLEVVLKCDNVGCLEAVHSIIHSIALPEVAISVIHAAVGDVNKSDIFLAETGSRLIIGFNIDVLPKLDHLLSEHEVEVRLYNVIYTLQDDLAKIAVSMIPHESREAILGKAKVIALYKSSRKGIILGCDVLEDRLALGDTFRLISAMGPVYTGRINSLHIENAAVQKATKGQKVGLKIPDFKKASIGDLVECYTSKRQKGPPSWKPRGGIFRI